jgi:ABC-type Fe3+-hydroxamate transport system substrate-binding protein
MTALVDASGVALELAHPPRRIVSLIPSTIETLCRPDQARELMREEWASPARKRTTTKRHARTPRPTALRLVE